MNSFNKSFNGVVCCALVLAMGVGAGCTMMNGARSEARPKHVVFVGMDGLATWCVKDNPAAMPTLARLMREGAWTLKTRSILPSSSACNWHSIFTCSASEQHGFNDWGTKTPVFPPSALLKSGLYPDVFAELRAQRPASRIDYFYAWSGMAFVVDTNVCDFVERASDEKLMALTVKSVRERKSDVVSVVFNEPDGAGHGKGWGSPEYIEGMKVLDGYLAEIVKAIEESGEAGETVLIVTSDHGGDGKKHGGPSLREMERPFVVWGKGVKRGYEIPDSSAVYDAGATMAWLLGLEFPQAWIGRPLVNAFE